MALFGVIRWDAWYSFGAGFSSGQEQRTFNVANLQSRAPWFAQVASAFSLQCIGSQANMDTECSMAATAGIDFFAFGNYQPTSFGQSQDSQYMSIAWNLYQSSPNNSLVKWCWWTGTTMWKSATFSDNTWQAPLANMATTQCTQLNYVKVLGNRPLVFIFGLGPSENTANIATAVSYFRSQCTSAGLGSPYIVLQYEESNYAATAARAVACGLDAVSNYGPGALVAPQTMPGDYSVLDAGVQQVWANHAAQTPNKMIPTGTSGWDLRPRLYCPGPNTHNLPRFGGGCYWTAPTPTRVGQHVQSMLTFLSANTSACESGVALLYSWNEFTEGGNCLCPTMGDPPQGVNGAGGTNLLNAVKAVLRP